MLIQGENVKSEEDNRFISVYGISSLKRLLFSKIQHLLAYNCSCCLFLYMRMCSATFLIKWMNKNAINGQIHNFILKKKLCHHVVEKRPPPCLYSHRHPEWKANFPASETELQFFTLAWQGTVNSTARASQPIWCNWFKAD